MTRNSNKRTIIYVGERSKARAALSAWVGDKPTLGERVDATRAARDHDTEPTPEPPAGPMPPDDATGSWVWVDLPDGAGRICVRAGTWIRVTPDELCPTGWAMQLMAPKWVALTAYTGTGGIHATAMDEGQVVPSTRVTPIPGRYDGAPGHDQTDA